MIQLPEYFEYNEYLLLFIANELNTGRFGTFLGNNERQRRFLKLSGMTESIWTYILINKD